MNVEQTISELVALNRKMLTALNQRLADPNAFPRMTENLREYDAVKSQK